MKKTALSLILAAVLAMPLSAQDAPAPDSDMNQGMDLLGRGAELLLQGLLAELGPAWDELLDILDNINAYHPPEMLPNGDIIFRRKQSLLPGDPENDGTATEL